ncbi:MAG: hypothetical protein LBT05_01740 [Planctomycetaceae bacterium]|jgi:hypothetical protein|nr:hypothetical protein [Planctomycetaceae bacterium]
MSRYFNLIVVIYLSINIILYTAKAQDDFFHNTFHVFEEGRISWIQNLQVYSTYTFKRQAFYSENDANISELSNNNVVATGIFCKDKDKIRFTVNYKKLPTKVSSNSFLNRSSDDIFNNQFWISYNNDQGKDYPSSGTLNKIHSNPYEVCPQLSALNSPLCLFLKPINNIPTNTTLTGSPVIKKTDDSHVIISLRSNTSRESYFLKDITIKVNTKFPIIEKIELNEYNNDNNILFTDTVCGMNWIEINGLLVPLKVRNVSGPYKVADKNNKIWITSEWESKDIGKRFPQKKDFYLILEQNQSLVGMNSIPQNGIVDIDSISENDFMQPGVDYGITNKNTTGNKYLFLRGTLVIIGITLILLALFKIYKERKK